MRDEFRSDQSHRLDISDERTAELEMRRSADVDRQTTARLVHLRDARDFQVADGDPDIRGWDVRTADGRKIGKVEDLIVDTGLMKVRYVAAVLDKDVASAQGTRQVLIPIGTVRLDDRNDEVFLSTNVVDPNQLPEYTRSELSRDYEVSVRDSYSGQPADVAAVSPDDDAFYRHEMFDDRRFLADRRRSRDDNSYIAPIDRRDARS